jgi:hypothetical protein
MDPPEATGDGLSEAAMSEIKESLEEQAALGLVGADAELPGIMTYDLETIPNEDVFPAPETQKPAGISTPLAEVSSLAVDKFKKVIVHATDDQLAELRGLEDAKPKPRDGAFKAIASTLRERTEEFGKWLKSHSVDPFRCRIVALGWCVGAGETRSLIARNDDEERSLVQVFWRLLGRDRTRCGYGITRFDDSIMINRSIALGVDQPRPLLLKKYGNQEAIDLEQFLFPHGQPKKCKDVARAWRIKIPCPDMHGGKVYEAYKAGDFTLIGDYVRSDVEVERSIYEIASRRIAQK